MAVSIQNLVNTESDSTKILSVCDEILESDIFGQCLSNKRESNLPSIVIADMLISQSNSSNTYSNYIFTDYTNNIYSFKFNITLFDEVTSKLCSIVCQSSTCEYVTLCTDEYLILPLYEITNTNLSLNQQMCYHLADDVIECMYFSLFENVNYAIENYSYLFQLENTTTNRTDNHVLETARDFELVQTSKFSEQTTTLGLYKISTYVISYIYDKINERELLLKSFRFSLNTIFGGLIILIISMVCLQK